MTRKSTCNSLAIIISSLPPSDFAVSVCSSFLSSKFSFTVASGKPVLSFFPCSSLTSSFSPPNPNALSTARPIFNAVSISQSIASSTFSRIVSTISLRCSPMSSRPTSPARKPSTTGRPLSIASSSIFAAGPKLPLAMPTSVSRMVLTMRSIFSMYFTADLIMR